LFRYTSGGRTIDNRNEKITKKRELVDGNDFSVKENSFENTVSCREDKLLLRFLEWQRIR